MIYFLYRTENSYDLHSKYDAQEITINQVQNWCSIDVNLILPAHEEYQQMPGLLKPCVPTKVFKKGTNTQIGIFFMHHLFTGTPYKRKQKKRKQKLKKQANASL